MKSLIITELSPGNYLIERDHTYSPDGLTIENIQGTTVATAVGHRYSHSNNDILSQLIKFFEPDDILVDEGP